MVYPGAVFVGNSPNQDPRRQDVSQVIIHHTASTGDVRDIRNMFMQDNSRSVSANFLVAQNGDVHEIVNPDTGRAWTTGSGPGGTISPDHSAITMEVMDETGAPGWTISEAAQETVSQIIAWAAERYGFTPVRGVNVRGHREMPGQSTACPGGMPLDSVTARGIDILNGVNKKGFLMALDDNKQEELYGWIKGLAFGNFPKVQGYNFGVPQALINNQNATMDAVRAIGKADVDETKLGAAIAQSLKPILTSLIGEFDGSTLSASDIADELAKRLVA
jgi:hypothetical protein